MTFDDQVRIIRQNDARQTLERKESDRRRHLARTALKETWEKVTVAIVRSGEQPDAQVATPEGIARGNAVNKRRPPYSTTERFLGETRIRVVPQRITEAWDRAVFDAIGPLVQPAWDMETYIYKESGIEQPVYGDRRYRYSHTGNECGDRLFLAPDSTIYRSSVVHPSQYSLQHESGYSYYPISTCMALRDDVAGVLQMALATLVARRELRFR
jgi:hypothetical protein